MDNLLFLYILLISFLTTFFSVPIVKKLGVFLNIIEKPKDRGQKDKSMVRSGGISMIFSYLFVILFLFILKLFNLLEVNYFFEFFRVFIICFLFFLIGLFDDFLQISPRIKLVFQIVSASIVCSIDLVPKNLSMPEYFGNIVIGIPIFLSSLITLIFIVGFVNSINWLDGLDGLASGYSGIASIGFATLGFTNGNFILCMIALTNLGLCFGFLRHNYYPAKIFMGDCGSYFLGANLSVMSLILLKSEQGLTNLFSIFLILLYPILDMSKVITIRIKKKKSPLFPGREHLHHFLVDYGFSDEQSVLILYFLSAFLTILSVGIVENNFLILFIPYFTLAIVLRKKLQIID